MKTFGSVVYAGTYSVAPGSDVLVGRRVANTEFLKALFRYGSFDRYAFFVGEISDATALERFLLQDLCVSPGRIQILNLLDLPRALQQGSLSVLHYYASDSHYLDVVWLRNRHAKAPIPITGQLHSLSYPRDMAVRIISLLWAPAKFDAIFSSSEAGKRVLDNCLDAVRSRLAEIGIEVPVRPWDVPVVPLGVDIHEIQQGNRDIMRRKLGIPPEAFVILSIARFTEYDKMDLFPLVQAFARLVQRVGNTGRSPVLLLAGARQGTKTPEMVQLCAKMLRVENRVALRVDFPEEEKKHLLAAADLFVSPCDNPQETFGQSVVEAMAAGLPVVVSDFDGYKETVSDDAGILVTTRWGADLSVLDDLGPILYERPLHLLLGQSIEVDLEELSSALHELYANHGKREAMAHAAKERAERNYAWDRVIRSYEEHWMRLARLAAAAPWAQSARHPLAMDFQHVFAHYPTQLWDREASVIRSPIGERIGAQYPIYPELTHVIAEEDVAAALNAARSATTIGNLAAGLRRSRPDHPGWHADFTIAWLLKHGLLSYVK